MMKGARTPLPPWTVERSSYVLKDRWISVRADACRTDEGTLLDPFYVLEYPDWVQVVAIDEQDRLVLIEQYRHGLGLTSLELPTGGIEPGDDDPIAAAKRELREEVGLGSGDWRLVATLAANPASQNNRCYVVLAQNIVTIGAPEDNPTERIRLAHLPVEEGAHLARSGGITQALHVAALALALTSIGRWLPGDDTNERDKESIRNNKPRDLEVRQRAKAEIPAVLHRPFVIGSQVCSPAFPPRASTQPADPPQPGFPR